MSPGATSQQVLALPSMGVSAPAVIPEDVDMSAILADIQDDGVSAPADQVAGLEAVVADAKADGYDVSFVVMPRALKFEYYRDIATELQTEVGGTVIVLGPNSVGSSSPYFSRVQQEEAVDNLTLTNPPQAAREMWDHMTGPTVNWTVVTSLLIVVVVIGAVIARLTSRRRTQETASTPHAAGTTDLSRDLP